MTSATRRRPVRDLAYIATFAAIVAALGLIPPIAVPIIPVPVTAQSLGVMLAALVVLSACGNTIRGLGRDTANAVDATQDAGRRVVRSVN